MRYRGKGRGARQMLTFGKSTNLVTFSSNKAKDIQHIEKNV